MTDDQVKEESKKASDKVEKLVSSISELSVLELSELVNALQDKLGVSAAPMAVAAAPAAGAPAEGGADAASEGGAKNLIMTGAGSNKIAVIKALREINQLWGLKEAKDMTDQVPAEVIKDGKAEDVKAGAEKLKAAGATVELK